MSGVITGLRSTSSSTCQYSIIVRLDCRERKELVAHVRIALCNGVKGRINCTAQGNRSCEATLGAGASNFVVTIRSGNNNLEFIYCALENSCGMFISMVFTSMLTNISRSFGLDLHTPSYTLDIGD
jgi:hypothetical protein